MADLKKTVILSTVVTPTNTKILNKLSSLAPDMEALENLSAALGNIYARMGATRDIDNSYKRSTGA